MWQPYLVLLFCHGFLVDASRPSPPLIKKQPHLNEILFQVAESSKDNQPIFIECEADGEPAPTYRYIKNGKPFNWLEYASRIEVMPGSGTIVIRSPREEDTGLYQCFATNQYGTATSNSVFLRNAVDGPQTQSQTMIPFFTTAPEVVTAAEEEDAVFNCEAQGTPEPSINWIFNGKPIEEAPVNNRRIVTSNSITIIDLYKSDTGNYGCNASNSFGYVYRDVFLNVLSLPPEIVAEPGTNVAIDEGNVTLTCKVFGSPKPQIKWIKDGHILSGDRFNVMQDGSLEITNVTFADAGQYECVAANKFGALRVFSTLVLRRRTSIINPPRDYEDVVGAPFIYRCSAVSDIGLELKIDWLKDGQLIDYTNSRYSKSDDNSLEFSELNIIDSGKYTCIAYTELDRDEATAILSVVDVPNAPKITRVECLPKSAIIYWEREDGNPSRIRNFMLHYQTSLTAFDWNRIYDNISSSDNSYTFAMSPGINYTFILTAWNLAGKSLPSNVHQGCSAQEDVPYKNPEMVEARGTKPDNIVVYWRPMAKSDHNGPGFHYRISCRSEFSNRWIIRTVENWNQSSLEISVPPAYHQYVVKVIAINHYGEASEQPRSVIGYPGEGKPTEAPGNFSVIEIFDTGVVVLGWAEVSRDSVNGKLKGYKIQVWSENDPEQKREIIAGAKTNRKHVTHLLPNMKHYAHIMVYNGQYDGPVSNTITFTTRRLGPVESLDALPLGSSAFWLSWKPPLQSNGRLTGYNIYHQEGIGSRSEIKFERPLQIADPSITSAKLAGLKPNTIYWISIRATTQVGEGYEFSIQRKILQRTPVAPDIPNFTCKIIASDAGNYGAIKVQWLPYGPQAGSYFFAQYRKKDTSNWEILRREINKDFIIIDGLDSGSTYEIRISAVNGDYATESQSQFIEIGEHVEM